MNDSEMIVAFHPTPWSKGKLIGQKPPLKLREIWALRTRLEMAPVLKRTQDAVTMDVRTDRTRCTGCRDAGGTRAEPAGLLFGIRRRHPARVAGRIHDGRRGVRRG